MTDWRQLGVEAARCIREGRVADGIDVLQQLLALRPEDADSWFNLAYLHRCARHYQAALDAYGEALRRGVARPEEAHINRAAIYAEHLNQSAPAAEELRLALKHNPRSLIAWLNLGNLHEDLGETAQARTAYREALKIAPRSGRALARLAAIEMFEGRTASAVAMLQDATKAGGGAPDDVTEICFALGSALDATKEYRAAFGWVEQGNRLAYAALPPAFRYDRARQEQLVDSLIASFPEAPPPSYSGSRAPYFICGMFRSGSTLAEQMLARHSRVTAGGELEFIPAMVQERLQPYPQALKEAPDALIAELRSEYLSQVESLHPGWDRLTDKRPDNFLHVGLIKTLFPDARIIHTVRQPLDNLLSVYFLHFNDGVPYSADLADTVHYYLQYRKLMNHWQGIYGTDILTLDYDRLVLGPRPEMERLLSFCGLEWEEACLDHGSGPATVRTASNWHVRNPLHSRSSGRWRNYAEQLAGVSAELSRSGVAETI